MNSGTLSSNHLGEDPGVQPIAIDINYCRYGILVSQIHSSCDIAVHDGSPVLAASLDGCAVCLSVFVSKLVGDQSSHVIFISHLAR